MSERKTNPLLLLLIAVFVILLVGAGAYFAGQSSTASASVPTPLPTTIPSPVPSPTPVVRVEAVTQQVQQLKQLVTTKFTIQVVADKTTQYYTLTKPTGTDKILLIGTGTVVAGIDFALIKPSDVTVLDKGKAVRVKLPPVQIFPFGGLNESGTYVYKRDTTPGFGVDPTLETSARQLAARQIVQTACTDGIMQVANDDAKKAVEIILRSAGIEQLEIVSAPVPTCPVLPEPTATVQ